ncbi:hypothetical protein EOA64_00245 [Mesorhizobium sp. M1A.F.Ca.IN.022.02.1.1]|uniref:hypothetical protein n=1 Tax=Mesorhizobium sp. M1A.F.Ca.IN.022.02.1.1 TaxID=2496766 RepID=UPI000FCC276B|nr:hypothetical protein [Mesorhizobium sp. M1A.F.Ca.IN.022.02.1.1]RUV65811.1 hypothetical protein EOA64_00245 [Mesorhizobium sp. M1A.F.Ca.IN.022.02.1.1]
MNKEVVEAWEFDNADELSIAVGQAVMLANSEGHKPDTVYTENKRRMTLVRETLSDGSTVMNLYFFDGERNA